VFDWGITLTYLRHFQAITYVHAGTIEFQYTWSNSVLVHGLKTCTVGSPDGGMTVNSRLP
jgi:hypothetical protein